MIKITTAMLTSYDEAVMEVAYDRELRTGGFVLPTTDEDFVKNLGLTVVDSSLRAILARNVCETDVTIVIAPDDSKDKNIPDIEKWCKQDYKKYYYRVNPNVLSRNWVDKINNREIVDNNLTDIFVYSDVIHPYTKSEKKDTLDTLGMLFETWAEQSLKYMLFFYSYYQPHGGWNDFVGGFTSIKEAKKYANKMKKDKLDQWHIINAKTGKKVKEREWHL